MTGAPSRPGATRPDGLRAPLPDRPALVRPGAPAEPGERRRARHDRFAEQPGLGVAGLLLVVPSAVLLAAAVGGPEGSLLVLAPLITFSLPIVAMVAFWWEDWPGSRLRKPWAGIVDTVLIAIAAVLLTIAGQAIIGHANPRAVFDPAPGPDHAPTFPGTLPLAAPAFVAMLQLTLVCEGWPLRRLPRIAGGATALAVSWAVAVILYLTLGTPAFGAYLVLVGLWQVWIFVVWRGWPFARITRRWIRIPTANLVVLSGAWPTYLAARSVADPPLIQAWAGMAIAAGLIVGMLFQGWAQRFLSPPWERAVTLAATIALAAALYAITAAIAGAIDFKRVQPEEWIGHVGLNALGLAVISHVAIGHRWPFHAPIHS
ncbi:hypothetical protein [Actinomadura sp. SCN-SB]|uniref:hypothetical protein n=1 Tax=Actinomadura sp. SCN-SB TaxID=3373092 RepID=UPI0037506BDE